MGAQFPDLLTGTEYCLVAQVPKAGGRWKQTHFNHDIARTFFSLEAGDERSVTLERLGASGEIEERTNRRLVLPPSNGNARIEFSFGMVTKYPEPPLRPLLVVVEAEYLTFRYRTLMPGDDGYETVLALNLAHPSIGKGCRRIVTTLDELELYWPNALLRGRP